MKELVEPRSPDPRSRTRIASADRFRGMALRLLMQALVVVVAVVLAVVALIGSIYVVIFLSRVLKP